MSSQPIPRPPSRSQRLLRDTLRKDDTLRTHAVHSTRPRSASSVGDDDDEDEDFFQSAILYRCSSRRDSAASALSHAQPNGFYIPDQSEHASYSTLLRSSSHSSSSRSGRSDRKSSPRSTRKQEIHEEKSRHHEPAPHEAVLRSRLDSVIHSMQIPKDADALEQSTASLPSSFGSTSNSRSHSHESHQTHFAAPDHDTTSVHPQQHRHRHTLSTPATRAPVSPRKRATSPHVSSSRSPPSPRSPRGLRSPPRSDSQEKDEPEHACEHSPWLYAPLPPSPPVYFVASPTAIDSHAAHPPTCSPSRHSSHSSSSFDPGAASLALKELQGYVSFASIAGLGAPPEEEERRPGRKTSPSCGVGGKGRLSGLGLGNGNWWIF